MTGDAAWPKPKMAMSTIEFSFVYFCASKASISEPFMFDRPRASLSHTNSMSLSVFSYPLHCDPYSRKRHQHCQLWHCPERQPTAIHARKSLSESYADKQPRLACVEEHGKEPREEGIALKCPNAFFSLMGSFDQHLVSSSPRMGRNATRRCICPIDGY